MPILPAGPSRISRYPLERDGIEDAAVGGNSQFASNYWFEWVESGNYKVAVLPPPSRPQTLTVKADFPTNITYTLGAIPKREHNKVKSWTVTMSGRTGVEERNYAGEGGMSPLEILKRFREFIEDYQLAAAENGATWLSDLGSTNSVTGDKDYYNYNKTTLIFRATREGEHLHCEPVYFEYDRNAASTRHSATWVLVLRAWMREEEGNTKGLVPVAGGARGSPPGQTNEAWQYLIANRIGVNAQLRDAVTKTIQAENMQSAKDGELLTAQRQHLSWVALRNYRREAAKALPGTGVSCLAAAYVAGRFPWTAVAADKLKQAQIASLSFERQAERFRECVRQGLAVTQIPLGVLASLRSGAEKLVGTIQDVVDTIASTFASYEALVDLLAISQSAQTDAVTMFGQAGGTPGTYDTAALPMTSPSGGGVYVPAGQMAGAPWVVPAGVYTWAQAAYALFGSTSYWTALAKLNNAKNGNSDKNGKPLMPGDVVLIPTSGPTGTNDPESVMGVGFRIDPAVGDLEWDQPAYLLGSGVTLTEVAAAGTGIALTKGIPNLVQAIRYRAITRRDAVPSLPGYGLLLVSPGQRLTEQDIAATFASMRPQMLQDLRVADVRDHKVLGEDDKMLISFRVIPVGPDGEGINVVAPIAGS